MQFESYGLAAGNANDLIDVKFTSGIKNIHSGFYPCVHRCMLALYNQYFPESCEKKITGVLLGWDSNPRPLQLLEQFQKLTSITFSVMYI